MSTRLTELAISDTGFIFDPGSGATFNVNATGLIALAALREGVDPADIAEIATRVRAHYPSAPPDIADHVSDFVRTLRQMGLVASPFGARSVSARPLTIAVTGLNATDNPAPGVPVLRSLRDGARVPGRRRIGLAYDALDPGPVHAGLWPPRFPRCPTRRPAREAFLDRLRFDPRRAPARRDHPTLDAELPAFIALEPQLRSDGASRTVPAHGRDQLELRGEGAASRRWARGRASTFRRRAIVSQRRRLRAASTPNGAVPALGARAPSTARRLPTLPRRGDRRLHAHRSPAWGLPGRSCSAGVRARRSRPRGRRRRPGRPARRRRR